MADASRAEELDSGIPDAGSAGLVWSATISLRDGGQESLVPGPGRVEIGQAIKLLVRVEPVLLDYRVRLLDGSDQVVPSDDEAQASDGGIDYSLAPLSPLAAGRTYVLHIDPETGPELRDARGATYRDVEQALAVAGVAEKPAPKPKRPPGHR